MTNTEALDLLGKILRMPCVVDRTIEQHGEDNVYNYTVRAIGPVRHLLAHYRTSPVSPPSLMISGFFDGQAKELEPAIDLLADWQTRRRALDESMAREWIEGRL